MYGVRSLLRRISYRRVVIVELVMGVQLVYGMILGCLIRIPRFLSRHVQSIMATVSALVDPMTSDWDVPLLKELFCDRDVALIMKIPISPSYNDQWCWRGDVRGMYTVKQGYRLLVEDAVNAPSQFTAWRLLWKLRLPPTVLNFIWRCARDILPTNLNLVGRGYGTVFVIFLQYSQMMNSLLGCRKSLKGETMKRFVHAWHCPWTPSEVVRRAVLLAEEWNTLFAAPGNLLINGSEHAIDPGINDGVIIHVDAAVFSDREEGYVSAVVHGSDGGYLAARNCSVRSIRNPILAEAMAVKEALSWAKDRGWHKVVLYSDCQLVCNLLKSSLPNNSYVGCIVRDCVSLKRYFVDVSFHYIARSVNTLAHVLARATASQSGPGVWFSSFPDCI
ncbi:uncharacterized protein LOC116023592 [Ipomoea triloba]|uniref:uncharacterized protein LOC116023592 n=1 Tax=Ipomoea triloba TaxID=35885 RepID=UPI00125D5D34|nr:uncharacterized protein LOC116023592 [Ipomoea triloba]